MRREEIDNMIVATVSTISFIVLGVITSGLLGKDYSVEPTTLMVFFFGIKITLGLMESNRNIAELTRVVKVLVNAGKSNLSKEDKKK